ncbi:hypothetical protein CDCA_CDCA17G4426 [Cyanidium caldarium]|uniref:Uncharacterized protein n=1 Tax=Cyanidium caldarium TaxID=2771 RepID=A0AAV9J1Z7_CYACA|nr:hypothetical protein CDCA_CDCA17G4426 [Cyanidium caldarium]
MDDLLWTWFQYLSLRTVSLPTVVLTSLAYWQRGRSPSWSRLWYASSAWLSVLSLCLPFLVLDGVLRRLECEEACDMLTRCRWLTLPAMLYWTWRRWQLAYR